MSINKDINQASDQELLAIGDADSFSILYQRHSDALYRYALMVSGVQSIAEDATQNSFMLMIERVNSFDGQRSSSARGWLYGFVRNSVRQLVRNSSKLVSMVEPVDFSQSADRLIELKGMAEDIVIAIGRLSLEQREVIVLCGLQEVDYLNASKILDIPLGTVRSRLSRARQNLMNALPNRHDLVSEEAQYEL